MSTRQKKEVVETKTVASHEDGKVYALKKYADGSFWCPCPKFRFQKIPVEQRICKHVIEAFGLRASDTTFKDDDGRPLRWHGDAPEPTRKEKERLQKRAERRAKAPLASLRMGPR